MMRAGPIRMRACRAIGEYRRGSKRNTYGTVGAGCPGKGLVGDGQLPRPGQGVRSVGWLNPHGRQDSALHRPYSHTP